MIRERPPGGRTPRGPGARHGGRRGRRVAAPALASLRPRLLCASAPGERRALRAASGAGHADRAGGHRPARSAARYGCEQAARERAQATAVGVDYTTRPCLSTDRGRVRCGPAVRGRTPGSNGLRGLAGTHDGPSLLTQPTPYVRLPSARRPPAGLTGTTTTPSGRPAVCRVRSHICTSRDPGDFLRFAKIAIVSFANRCCCFAVFLGVPHSRTAC